MEQSKKDHWHINRHATCKDCPPEETVHQSELESNARLIAAAPDMLKALELASGRIAHDDDCELSDVHPCKCTKMDMEQVIISAIAKAKGKGEL